MLLYQNSETLVKLLCSVTGAVAECSEMHTCSEEKPRGCCGCEPQAPVSPDHLQDSCRTGAGALLALPGAGAAFTCPSSCACPCSSAAHSLELLRRCHPLPAAPDTPGPHLAGPQGTQGCADNASPKETGQGHNPNQAQLLPLVITWQSCFQRRLQGLRHCCLAWFGGEQEHGELFSLSQGSLFFCSSFV